jgi:hypothetical protein
MGTAMGSGVGGPSVTGRSPVGVDDAARERRTDLVAALAGLAFIALMIVNFFTPGIPALDGSPEGMAAELNADRSGHQLSVLLGQLGDIAFLVFLAGLWSRLRRHEGIGGMLAGLFAIAGAAFVATILVTDGMYLALVQAADTLEDPSALPALAVLDWWIGQGILPAGVALFGAAAAAILLTRALPVWLGWLAGLTALLLLISIGSVYEASGDEGPLSFVAFGGFLLMLIWVLATSIVLFVRAGREARAAV